MVETKQKPIAAVVLKSKDVQNPFHNSSNVAVDSNLAGEDNWVVVKKQKVTILIPSLPSSEHCRLPDLDLSRAQLPPQKPRDICLVERDVDVMPLSPPDKAVSNQGPGKMELREHNFEAQDGVIRPFCRKKRSPLKFHETTHKPLRAFGQPGHLRVNLPGCITILNKTMRATNLNVKIVRAGGWRRWLSSLGLEQFERIFCGKNVNKFHVGNLSMSKLKDMGYDAVGPRRKLIHAIECLY